MQDNSSSTDNAESERDFFAESIDRIQHRYGWTDEIILSLPYLRYSQICEVVGREYSELILQGYRNSVYPIYIDRAKKGISWKKFMEGCGLGEYKESEPEMTPEEHKEHVKNMWKKFEKGYKVTNSEGTF